MSSCDAPFAGKPKHLRDEYGTLPSPYDPVYGTLPGPRHTSPRTYVYVICIATSRRCSHHKGSSVASALSVKDGEIYSPIPIHQLQFGKVKEYRKMTKSKKTTSRKGERGSPMVLGFDHGESRKKYDLTKTAYKIVSMESRVTRTHRDEDLVRKNGLVLGPAVKSLGRHRARIKQKCTNI